MPPLQLSHTFSIHSWFLTRSDYGTLFSKRKWDDPNNEKKFTIEVRWNWDDEELTIQSTWYVDEFTTCPSYDWIEYDTWHYLIQSYEYDLSSGNKSEMYLDTYKTTTSCAGRLIFDDESYLALIGSTFSSHETDYSRIFDGYIYDFHVYQSKYTLDNTNHVATCASGCGTQPFNEYEAGSTCQAAS